MSQRPSLVPASTTIVVPAHNEARYLPVCLAAIERAANTAAGRLEVVVVANRCSDRTAEIAERAGARVVENAARSIAAVRNAGAAVASGDVLVTVDADCAMAPNTLSEVDRYLSSGRFVGGGTKVVPERRSAGIVATYALMELAVGAARLGGGLFWVRRSDFEAIGGFDTDRVMGEDIDFARRLRAHGRRTGRKFTNIRSAPLVASCRKFDVYGDWHMFTLALQAKEIMASMRGTDTRWVDRYFFDFNDDEGPAE